MDIQRACNYLVSLGFRLPYEVIPGSFPGGVDTEFSEETWLEYVWNPPSGLGYDAPDLGASTKFSWDQILWADFEDSWADLRTELTQFLNHECKRRITENYGAKSAEDEIFKRLLNIGTPALDAVRTLSATAFWRSVARQRPVSRPLIYPRYILLM